MGRPKNTPEIIWQYIDKSAGDDACWIWTGCRNKDDYGVIGINWKQELAHRVAFKLVNGHIDDGIFACHSCDNPPCCNPKHLFAGTILDNHADMISKNRQAQGITSGSYTHPEKIIRGSETANAKLTEAQVLEIRTLYANSKIKRHELATMFGIGVNGIEKIIRGIIWNHVPNPCKGIKIQSRIAKLSEDSVLEMRKLKKSGATVTEIMNHFKLSRYTVNDVVYYRTWKHLE